MKKKKIIIYISDLLECGKKMFLEMQNVLRIKDYTSF